MITVKELTGMFPVKDVAPYGKCVIIPAVSFGHSWEQDLKQQGCKIFSGSFQDKAVFYVKLPQETTRKERKGPKGPGWTEKEDQILVALVKEKLSAGQEVDFEEIAKQLPGRSGNGVKMRITRLQKKGLLPELPRRKYGRRKKDKAAPPSVPSTTDKTKVVKELLQASAMLYPGYPHACAILLREVTKEMEFAEKKGGGERAE